MTTTANHPTALRTVSAGVNLDRLGFLVDALVRNYSFPLQAVVREWVSNARDAQTVAGVQAQVIVQLPTAENGNTLVVKDTGVGMTLSDLMDNCTSFGGTTKENDVSTVGNFGIGLKSALAVSDSYTIRSVQDGLENVVRMYRSEEYDDIAIDLILENDETDQLNGTTLSVEVNESIALNVNQSSLYRVLAGWTREEVRVVKNITSSEEVAIPRIADFGTKTENGYVFNSLFKDEKDWWKTANYFGLIRDVIPVIVGGVFYTFDMKYLNTRRVSRRIGSVVLPANAVKFSSGREVIEVNDESIETISAAYTALTEDAEKMFKNKVAALDSHEEALELAETFCAIEFDLGVTFRGETITPVVSGTESDVNLFRITSKTNYRGNIRDTGFRVSRISSTFIRCIHGVINTGKLDNKNKALSLTRKWLNTLDAGWGSPTQPVVIAVTEEESEFLSWSASDKFGTTTMEQVIDSTMKKKVATGNKKKVSEIVKETPVTLSSVDLRSRKTVLRKSGTAFSTVMEEIATPKTIVFINNKSKDVDKDRFDRGSYQIPICHFLTEEEATSLVFLHADSGRQMKSFAKLYPNRTFVTIEDWLTETNVSDRAILRLENTLEKYSGMNLGLDSVLRTFCNTAKLFGYDFPKTFRTLASSFENAKHEIREVQSQAFRVNASAEAETLGIKLDKLYEYCHPSLYAVLLLKRSLDVMRISSVPSEDNKNTAEKIALQQFEKFIMQSLTEVGVV